MQDDLDAEKELEKAEEERRKREEEEEREKEREREAEREREMAEEAEKRKEEEKMEEKESEDREQSQEIPTIPPSTQDPFRNGNFNQPPTSEPVPPSIPQSMFQAPPPPQQYGQFNQFGQWMPQQAPQNPHMADQYHFYGTGYQPPPPPPQQGGYPPFSQGDGFQQYQQFGGGYNQQIPPQQQNLQQIPTTDQVNTEGNIDEQFFTTNIS